MTRGRAIVTFGQSAVLSGCLISVSQYTFGRIFFDNTAGTVLTHTHLNSCFVFTGVHCATNQIENMAAFYITPIYTLVSM